MTTSLLNFRNLFVSAFALTLSACEIGGEKREAPKNTQVLMSYFFSTQYATEEENLRDFMAQFQSLNGAIAATVPAANMSLYETPPMDCGYSSTYNSVAGENMGIQRLLDAGTLRIRNPDNAVIPLIKTSSNQYGLVTVLESGRHLLMSEGTKSGALNFDQEFEVPAKGGGIVVHALVGVEGSNPITLEQPLASPAVPQPGDENYTIIFDRFLPATISFGNPPAGTLYVRVRLRDGSNQPSGDITCFGKPNEAILLKQGYLRGFRASNSGHLEVDFINISTVKKVGRLKKGSIVSAMRHFHGSFDYSNPDGSKTTVVRGRVEFR